MFMLKLVNERVPLRVCNAKGCIAGCCWFCCYFYCTFSTAGCAFSLCLDE